MTLHKKYQLSPVINACGTFTPLGVSRSSKGVCEAAASSLSQFFIMDELQEVASRAISGFTGAEAGAVVHCVSAAISVSIAAVITGTDQDKVASLPNLEGLSHKVIIPAGHVVNYGHPILQDIRLIGATPVIAGNENACTLDELAQALAQPEIACLLMVSSRLTRGHMPDFTEAVMLAHQFGVPVIIDGAAQDFRLKDLLATGADLVLTSAQKYLAAPTAGLIMGRKELIAAVRAQERGIGRAMKATKEAIIGVLAAIEERKSLDLNRFKQEQQEKNNQFIQQLKEVQNIKVSAIPDPTGLPFDRVMLTIDSRKTGIDACSLVDALKTGTPPIWVMAHECEQGHIILETVALNAEELQIIAERLAGILNS